MLIRCRECGGTVSDKASACPHCGAPAAGEQIEHSPEKTDPPAQEKAPRRIPVGNEEEEPSLIAVSGQIVPSSHRPADAFLAFMRFCFVLIAVLIVCGAACFFILRGNVGGITEKLRTIAESDSGDGSHIDRSGARMMFKFHLAAFLDAVQGKNSSHAEPVGKTLPKSDLPSESFPQPKTERKPLELPPPPPENL